MQTQLGFGRDQVLRIVVGSNVGGSALRSGIKSRDRLNAMGLLPVRADRRSQTPRSLLDGFGNLDRGAALDEQQEGDASCA